MRCENDNPGSRLRIGELDFVMTVTHGVESWETTASHGGGPDGRWKEALFVRPVFVRGDGVL